MRVEVCAASDLTPGAVRAVSLDEDRRVAVANVDGQLRAFSAICTHAYAELDKGPLREGNITCPLHFSEFDTGTGEALTPPATEPLAVYAVKVEGGKVVVEVP